MWALGHVINDDQEGCRRLSLVMSLISLASLPFPFVQLWREEPASMYKIPVHMCAASAALSVAVFYGSSRHSSCFAQSVLIQYFGLALVLLWGALTVNFFQIAVLRDFRGSWPKYYCVGSWLLPFLPLAVGVAFDRMQKERPIPQEYLWQCWVEAESSLIVQFGLLYGWMSLAIIVGLILWPWSLISFFRLACAIHSEGRPPSPRDAAPDRPVARSAAWWRGARIFVFFMFFLVLYVGVMAYRMRASLDHSVTWCWAAFHTVSVSSTGIFCFVVYGLPRGHQCLWAICRCLCCCCWGAPCRDNREGSGPLLGDDTLEQQQRQQQDASSRPIGQGGILKSKFEGVLSNRREQGSPDSLPSVSSRHSRSYSQSEGEANAARQPAGVAFVLSRRNSGESSTDASILAYYKEKHPSAHPTAGQGHLFQPQPLKPAAAIDRARGSRRRRASLNDEETDDFTDFTSDDDHRLVSRRVYSSGSVPHDGDAT